MNANAAPVLAERAGLFAARADRGQPGDVSPTVAHGYGGSTITATAKQARFGRWCPSRQLIVQSFAVGLATAGNTAGDPLELMVFDAAGTTLIYDSGALTGKLNGTPATAIVIGSSLALTFSADTNYWVGVYFDSVASTAGTLCALTGSAPWSALFATGIAAAGSAAAEGLSKSGMSGVPASLAGFGSSPNIPLVACREF